MDSQSVVWSVGQLTDQLKPGSMVPVSIYYFILLEARSFVDPGLHKREGLVLVMPYVAQQPSQLPTS